MAPKASVPDAWDDDDWEAQVDKLTAEDHVQPKPQQPPLSKAERLTQHAETNRKLWESAETKETFHFLEVNNTVPPVATNLKPQVKVLSRRPVVAKRDPITGLSSLSLEDDDDDTHKEVQLTSEEIRAKQKRDREEKQRRYEEARAKIFGESASSSRGSSPGGTTTPPRNDGRLSSQGRGRGRGRGGPSRNNNNENRQFDNVRPATQPAPGRELFDPSQSPRPDSLTQRRLAGGDSSSRASPARDDGRAIREPKGPDGSGRGGFGFARRGARET